MKVTIYYNPRCSKSRGAMKILEELGIEAEEVAYLETGVTAEVFLGLAGLIDGPARDLVRAKEAAYGEAGLSGESTLAEIAAAVAAHPVLMQRPIVVCREKALIARPPEVLRAWLAALG